MGLSDLIASGIATAKTTVGDLLVTVTHHPASGSDGYQSTFGADVSRQALWEEAVKPVLTRDGFEKVSIGKLTFLEPVVVGANDLFTVNARATKAPVLKTNSLVNPGSGQPFLMEVWLGPPGSFTGS